MSEEKLNPDSTLDKVLSYVDSPFKLMAIVIMGVLAFSGYFIWNNQELLRDAYKESKKLPEINTGRADEAAAMLFKKTGAQVVAIFKVSPIFNNRVVYKAYTRDGRDKSVEDIDVGLFTQNQGNNADVIRLMANEIPCSEYRYAQSEVGLWYIDKGVTFTCRISVPPDSNRFVGQITVGWADKPENVEVTRFMLEIAAAMLTKRGN